MTTFAVPATQALPGPRTLPVLGWRANLLPLLQNPIGHMRRLWRTYGDVVTLAEGHTNFVFVFSPQYNHQILSDPAHFYNGDGRSANPSVRIPPDSAAARLFSGITTMNAGKHTQQRRLLMPAFHKKRVEALRDDMIAQTSRRLAGWQVGQERDLLREMKSLTLAVAMQSILGLDPAHEGEGLRRDMESWLRVALSPAVLILPVPIPGSPFARMLAGAERVEAGIRRLIAARRARGGEGSDALSMLLAAHDEDGTRLTDDELIGQVTALFVAGHETTATALAWTLFLLAQHPRVLADLRDELDGTLHGDAPTVEQMNALPLLDGVIKESLRLIPPGLLFLRVTQEPTSFGPYTVPPGTRVLWTPVVTHRMPDLYPQPDRFRPDRWATIDPSPYEYLPFGAGPRRCLGATFATMEMKLILPVVLQRYSLALRPQARIALGGSFLATPRHGLPMRLLPPGARPGRVPVRGNIGQFVDLRS